ncbi:MAG: amidoligase family protein [bacterium]|nr:amidoligase family protein [bacterium]
MQKNVGYQMPPTRYNEAGELRRVGFELEFTSGDFPALARRLAALYDREPQKKNPFIYQFDSPWGLFQLELDAKLLKEQGYRKQIEKLGLELPPAWTEQFDQWTLEMAQIFVPQELITPPLPLDQLAQLDRLAETLIEHNSQGTGASFLYAFGFQFNPEVAQIKARPILNQLRAFLLHYEALIQSSQSDLSRRLAPYIRAFPQEYVRKILDPSYQPDLTALMDDYLSYNPTRNRPLDLTVLFAQVDQDKVLSQVAEPDLIKPRPTYHYRLPDSRIDEPGWSLAAEWNRWVKMERLAEDERHLEQLSLEYLERPKGLEAWVAQIKAWFEP